MSMYGLDDQDVEREIFLEAYYQRVTGMLHLVELVLKMRRLPATDATIQTLEPFVTMALRAHTPVEERIRADPELNKIYTELKETADGCLIDTSFVIDQLKGILTESKE